MNPKALSLVSWTFQNVAMTLLMKASVQGSHYSTCVAVLMDEAIKLVVCYAILSMYYYRGIGTSYAQVRDQEELGLSSPVEEPMNQKRTLGGLLEFLEIEVFGSVSDFIYMCVPAICYAVQKNLSFVAITNLSPALYQVLFQGKNLTTAFFSYLMLGKHFSHRQKFSLILLGVGVALMEFSSLSEDSHTGSGSILKGTIAVACACVSSGFSGVYIERAIKRGDTVDKPYSLWVRNVQLSTFGVIASVLMVLHDDKEFVDTHGVFGGFTSLVWFMVLLSSVGGLVTAFVMKYADNILKSFANSIAIILTAIVSTIAFDFHINLLFIVGTGIVLFSVHLYSTGGAKVAAAAATSRITPASPREMDILPMRSDLTVGNTNGK